MGPAKPCRENVGPEDILSVEKGRGLQHPEEEEPNSALLSEHSGWQGNILNFHSSSRLLRECPSQSLLTSSACSLDSLALQHVRGAGQQILEGQECSSSQRRRCLTKPEIPVSFTAQGLPTR